MALRPFGADKVEMLPKAAPACRAAGRLNGRYLPIVGDALG